MNQNITSAIGQVLEKDDNTMLILCGIAMYSFKRFEENCPGRVVNIGIMEQTAVGMAAGMAAKGMIPFVYTWAPFLVERAYEQLELGFGSQKLAGNFFGLGGSYDLTAFGDSHYCPNDVCILKQIKNIQIIVPGTDDEFQSLLLQAYDNEFPTYYRVSAQKNEKSYDVQVGKAKVIQRGNKGTVIAVGPLLDTILKVAEDYDVTVLYYTTVAPFDINTFRENFVGNRVMICEPYNSGAIAEDILKAVSGEFVKIEQVGLEKNMVCEFGRYEDNLANFGLRVEDIRGKIERLLA